MAFIQDFISRIVCGTGSLKKRVERICEVCLQNKYLPSMHAVRLPAVLPIAIALSTMGASEVVAEDKYFSYETFKGLTALCPKIRAARLIGLEVAGQDLWSRGQLRLPAKTHLFEGDFNHTGKLQAAIVITDGTKNYIVIAELRNAKWQRTGFLAIGKLTIEQWNGRALCLDEKSFVAWSGKKYRLERGPLALYCYGYEPSDFNGVMIKFSNGGVEEKPTPGLLISSFYRWPNLQSFKQHRKPGSANDEPEKGAMWHLTMSPRELRDFVIALNQSSFIEAATDRNGTAKDAWYDLAILDANSSTRPNYLQLFLNGKETVALLQTFAKQIEQNNADGAKVLQEYARMFAG